MVDGTRTAVCYRKRNRRMVFMQIVIWLMVHEPLFVAGLGFTLSPSRVLLGTTGTLKMTCSVTETDVFVIYNIQIRRETSPGSNYTWETLAEIDGGLSKSPVLNKNILNDKDFVAGGKLDKKSPINTYLTLDMNKEKLTKSDTRDYRCELNYKNNITYRVVSIKRNTSISIVDENDKEVNLDEALSDPIESVEYVKKSTLVIVGVVLGLTNSATLVACARVIIVVMRKPIEKRSDDKSQHHTGQKLLSSRETYHQDSTIQGTDVTSA